MGEEYSEKGDSKRIENPKSLRLNGQRNER